MRQNTGPGPGTPTHQLGGQHGVSSSRAVLYEWMSVAEASGVSERAPVRSWLKWNMNLATEVVKMWSKGELFVQRNSKVLKSRWDCWTYPP